MNTMLWDNILVPLGWISAGIAPGRREHYWKSPGGRTTAVTDHHELRFWRGQSDWLCGLKEASEAGVQLTRPVVTCVLGLDGDIEAFA